MNHHDPRPQIQPRIRTETDSSLEEIYSRGNVEAHIIADMLRIENIANEMRDFKEIVKERLDKIENWIVGIVGITITSLVAILVGMMSRG